MHLPSSLRIIGALSTIVLVASACGSEVSSSGDGGGGGATTTSTGAGGTTSGQGGASQGGSTGTGGAGPIFCNPGQVNCAMPAPSCPIGEVASVEGGCWGPCVPVLSCATDESCEDCKGFCAVYEAWTIEYRCVLPTVQCAALACVCLAQYLCPSPYDACVDGDPGTPGAPLVHCGCPAC